ncbi:hypothetical protein ABI59_12560 [Acidobacteria bacterium Mor1]|nr:hypothetical protein ABI59_12560 [Acidobacteria bacterium Mor1]
MHRFALPLIMIALLAAPLFAQQPAAQRVPAAAFAELFPAKILDNLNPNGGPAKVNLVNYIGKKPVVFYYMAPGHVRSEEVLQELVALVDKLGREKVALLPLVFIRSDADPSAFKTRINELKLDVPVLRDDGFVLGQQLTVATVPNISILDSSGKLRLAAAGALKQTVEYNLDIAGVISRAAKTGNVGTYGPMPPYYPVVEMVDKDCPDFEAAMVGSGARTSWSKLFDPKALNVLVFWSVDCGHCKKTMPEINEWLKRNPDGYNIITAARVENSAQKQRTEDYCKIQNFVFPTLIDDNKSLGDLFQVTATPTILVVGPGGKIDSVFTSGNIDFDKDLGAKRKQLLGS